MKLEWNNAATMMVGLLALSVVLFFVFRHHYPREKGLTVRQIAAIGIFGAMSAVLYVVPIFTIKLPFFPSFLTLHFDEIPVLICAIAFGPEAGLGVILVKTLIKLPISSTLYVGELCDLILSSVYVLITVFLYRRFKGVKGMAIALGIATPIQVLTAMLLNVYVMIPFYMTVFGFTEQGLLFVMQKAVPMISNVGWSYAFFAVLPFNLLKDAIVVAVSLLIYQPLRIFIEREQKKA